MKLVFSEYIEEFLKENSKEEKVEQDKNEENEENEDEDDDLNDGKTGNVAENKENKENEENEDDDLKVNKDGNDENKISVSDAINNELANLNANSVCEWIQGPDGLVIIDILDKNVRASELLAFVFDKFHPNRPTLSPFAYKLFPLDCTSFSRQNDMIDLGKKMVSKEDWDKICKEDPWAINYKNRGNKKLDRKSIVDGIAESVPNGYKVDLKNPKTVILLQTFGRTAGISVIKNGVFHKHKEYNLSNFEL